MDRQKEYFDVVVLKFGPTQTELCLDVKTQITFLKQSVRVYTADILDSALGKDIHKKNRQSEKLFYVYPSSIRFKNYIVSF